MEKFFSDREIFADFVTRYYTDYEPGSLWIAEKGGEVIGYLTGCLDSRRYERMMAWKIIPAVFVKAVGRGVFFRKGTWRLLLQGIRMFLRGGFRSGVSLKEYPAHLHIDLSRDARGQGAGRSLMDRFVGQVRRTGLRGVHLVTRDDNKTACRFFEQAGFKPVSRLPMVQTGSDPSSCRLIYGMKL